MGKSKMYAIFKFACMMLAFSIIQACSLNVPIDNPGVSKLAYSQDSNTETITLKLEDKLDAAHKVSHGRVTINLKHDGGKLDTAPFVFASLKKELESRRLPVNYSDDAQAVISLEQFELLNHRVNGFSPMVTISTMKAVLKTDSGSKTIASMVKRGKVPVWTMSEINEPCFNEPIELMIKEFAAKINQALFNYSLDDEQVNDLVEKIKLEADNNKMSYFDVYELGFSNNPKAIEPLLAFTQHSSEYVRLAAISSLGILGAEQHFEDLKVIYLNGNLWQDRGMALKAIGDLGSEQAMVFLLQEKDKWLNESGNEAKWNSLFVDLYVD